MSSSLRTIVLLVVLGGIAVAVAARQTGGPELPAVPASPLAAAKPPPATEQHWIVEDVVNAIAGLTLGSDSPSARATQTLGMTEGTSPTFRVALNGVSEPLSVIIVEHVWSPDTYAPLVEQLLRASVAGPRNRDDSHDLAVRFALTELSVRTLLDVNQRVSTTLEGDPRSSAAHESAALLVGAFALRESVGMFADVRPALSRMAAHLAMAQALRRSGEETLDGTCARGVLAALAGLQRHTLAIVSDIKRTATTDADRAWAAALQLRVTGDWRNPQRAIGATLLERLEYARAVRSRRGDDAFLAYAESGVWDDAPDLQRIAFNGYFNVEASHRFTQRGIDRELAEARSVWSRYHGGEIANPELMRALNDRPSQSPLRRVEGRNVVQVLDWGTWAAFHQRHLCHGLAALSYRLWNLSDEDAKKELPAQLDPLFGELTLYPLVLRWIAQTPAEYERALVGARALVATVPELLPAATWNFLLAKPHYAERAGVFPAETAWFTPGVPSGTAFDLGARSLRAGCPRPPTLMQAAVWANEMPYDQWTQWSHAYFAAGAGVPSLAVIRRAFGPLLEYDEAALLKVIEYTAMPLGERIALTRSLCFVSASRCPLLAELLLLEDRELEAAKVYEKWFANARDRVGVANNMMWLMRYYVDHGNASRAETIARGAAATGSARGIEVLAEFLDRSGQYQDAERQYRKIDENYANHSTPLGTFLMRRALKNRDAALENKAAGLLHESFPAGLQRVVNHALPVQPVSGVAFDTFGKRAFAAGLEQADVIIGVDGWRVNSAYEYSVASRLNQDPMMTLTVWRGGRYFEVKARVPQRWLGCRLKNFVGGR